MHKELITANELRELDGLAKLVTADLNRLADKMGPLYRRIQTGTRVQTEAAKEFADAIQSFIALQEAFQRLSEQNALASHSKFVN